MDTGPTETWPVLQERLKNIPADRQGRRHIDLAIVSHIDHDHIGAARFLFADEELGLTFGDVWFNARHHLDRSPPEGDELSRLLSAPGRPLSWNLAFGGGAVVTPDDQLFLELPSSSGTPRITLLSPTNKRLLRLASVWDAEQEKLRRGESDIEAERGRSRANVAHLLADLQAIADETSRKDSTPANGSSIAILVEHNGASALLAADAFPTVLGSALLKLLRKRGLAKPLAVDILKVSHHGSRANLIDDLLKVVRARDYVLSTDNTRFGHPDDEAVARIVLRGGNSPRLCFNYATDDNRRWADQELQDKYGYQAVLPRQGVPSVTLTCSGH